MNTVYLNIFDLVLVLCMQPIYTL